MRLEIPEAALVLLIGATGSGKSTFAARHFAPTEVVSSDRCRAMVADDENDMDATAAAFRVLHAIVRERLAAGRLTAVDATDVISEFRRPLVELAREFHRPPVAIVLDVPEAVCAERNRLRAGRRLPRTVIRRHREQLRRSRGELEGEGFAPIHVLDSVEAMDQAEVIRRHQ